MADFLLQVLRETWSLLKEASVFLLAGFLLAGVLGVFVPKNILIRLVGTGRVKSVLWGAALGAPLPLCSCGVLPTALGLRRQGATEGATVAFLVATPETGIDSISLSYALTDPILTIFRPIAGVVTAIAAGLATNFFGVRTARAGEGASTQAPDNGSCAAPHAEDHMHHHVHADPCDTERRGGDGERGVIAVRETAGRIYHYAFHELLDDTSYWLILGFVLSGVVAALLPADFFERYLSGGVASMLVMLLISIPVYTCASSSTPLAAAMVIKGLNPGAALVFLLAGPATNLGSLVVLLKFLGARIVAVYLAAIGVVALLAGYALNWIYRAWGVDPRASFGTAADFIPEPVKIAAALLLIALLALSVRRTHVPAEWVWVRDRIAVLTGISLTAARLALAALIAFVGLYLSSGLFAVQPGEIGVRLRFGKVTAAELSPGLHYRLPWPFETDRILQTALVQRMEFGFPAKRSSEAAARASLGRERMTAGGNPIPEPVNVTGTWFQRETSPGDGYLLTGDGNLIDLRSAVQYRVKDALAFAFNVEDPQALVRGATLAALRGVVAASGIDALYTSARSEAENRVVQALQRTLDKAQSGIEVLSFRLLYVHPPDEVHDAFRDVASAQEDKLRMVNRANTFAVEKVNQSKGEAASMLEQSLAFKDQQIRHAQADAGGFALRLGAYRQAPDLTRFRMQVETIEDVLPGVTKFIRPGVGEVKDFDIWLLQPPGTSGRR
jgi:HflK protein